MPLAAGTRLGPYEILAPVGAGGMGEVYRARDTRLDRTVAVKVLSAHLDSAAARERFEREARAVSSLNHPNICALYDVGSQDGVDYLVMEYLEGETLAARLSSGPLPIEKVFEYGIQIAGALDQAHRQGVVHRDLKPGNIMLTRSGAKLLDFGLAKIHQARGAEAETMTIAQPLTTQGSILGTFQYMAPEQLEGVEADARSDLFALGAVLYEMVTGRKAFEGKTQASVIAGILEREPPPISQSQPLTPPALEHLVRTCLAKDPDERRQSAHDVWLELKWIAEGGSQAGVPVPVISRRKSRERIAWIVASLMFVTALALAVVHFRETPPERQVLHYTLAPPEKTTVDSFALSPDGRYLAIAALSGTSRKLWVRALDSPQAQLLAGTDDARFPFWSPDSRSIAFFAQGKLKRIAVNGGPAQTICDARLGRGGTWNREGMILFTPANAPGVSRVPAAGGVPVPVNKGGGRFPTFLPDGRFLSHVVGSPEQAGIYLASLDSKENRRLLADNSNPMYVAPGAGSRNGHVLFIRESTLMAQPVGPKSMQPAGELFPVAEGVAGGLNSGTYGLYSVSENGLLIYQPGRGSSEGKLVWFDRHGKELGATGASYQGGVRSSGFGGSFALSPDEKRVVISRQANSQASSSDLWMYDLERGTASRFTFHASVNLSPVWSPDGGRVAFSSSRGGIYQKASNGAGEEELLHPLSTFSGPTDWSRDGRFIIFRSGRMGAAGSDLEILPLSGDRKPIPLPHSQFDKQGGRLSPDGRWLAYSSTESGRPEVYVQPFSAGADPGSAKPAAGKWQISTAGGFEPRWRADGKELYYATLDGKLMAVQVGSSGAGFERGSPDVLFAMSSGLGIPAYAPSADGKRFLIATRVSDGAETQPLTVVVNWLAGVKK